MVMFLFEMLGEGDLPKAISVRSRQHYAVAFVYLLNKYTIDF